MKKLLASVVMAAMLCTLPVVAATDSFGTSKANTSAQPQIHQDHKFGEVIVVEQWVLCITQKQAEELAWARSTSIEYASQTYKRLADAKECGLFPILIVVLEQKVYQDFPVAHKVRVFSALFNSGGIWLPGFVVEGAVVPPKGD